MESWTIRNSPKFSEVSHVGIIHNFSIEFCSTPSSQLFRIILIDNGLYILQVYLLHDPPHKILLSEAGIDQPYKTIWEESHSACQGYCFVQVNIVAYFLQGLHLVKLDLKGQKLWIYGLIFDGLWWLICGRKCDVAWGSGLWPLWRKVRMSFYHCLM